MKRKTGLLAAATVCVAVAIVAMLNPITSHAQMSMPKYVVDPSWPTLPDRWVLGGQGGLCVDHQDHVFILNRQDVLPGDLNAGKLAPMIIEFDQAGKVVNSWGDQKMFDQRLHSCFFDKDHNMWIASAPSGMIQKYTHDGKFLSMLGDKEKLDTSDGTAKGTPLNSPAARFTSPSALYVDPKNGDLYMSDGESARANHRVAVFDKDGTFLRQWNPEGMSSVHCMSVSNDGWVYVCNRENHRLQVYDKMGTFQKNIEVPWTPATPPEDGKPKESGGAAVSLDFSHDQKLMFLINQNNSQIEIIDREAGKVLGHFGGGVGHYAGQFDQPHGLAVDSKDNVYVTENRGKRVQKFKKVP